MYLDSVWLVLKFYFWIKTCLGSNFGQVILLEGSFLFFSIICLAFEEGRRVYLLIDNICGSWLLINSETNVGIEIIYPILFTGAE